MALLNLKFDPSVEFSVCRNVSADLDERLNRIYSAISDQALYFEGELNAATTADDITKIERRAEASRLLLEHVQTAAWEKAKAIQ